MGIVILSFFLVSLSFFSTVFSTNYFYLSMMILSALTYLLFFAICLNFTLMSNKILILGMVIMLTMVAVSNLGDSGGSVLLVSGSVGQDLLFFALCVIFEFICFKLKLSK